MAKRKAACLSSPAEVPEEGVLAALEPWESKVTATGIRVTAGIENHYARPDKREWMYLDGDLAEGIEDLLVLATAAKLYLRRVWKFAAAAEAMAEKLWPLLTDHYDKWWESPKVAALAFMVEAERCAIAAVAIGEGEPAPQIRTVVLESVRDLRRQRVPDRQICLIYGWVDPNGMPQMRKVAEELKTPGAHPPCIPLEHELPSDWPTKAPVLGMVTKCVDQVLRRRDPGNNVGPPAMQSLWDSSKRVIGR